MTRWHRMSLSRTCTSSEQFWSWLARTPVFSYHLLLTPHGKVQLPLREKYPTSYSPAFRIGNWVFSGHPLEMPLASTGFTSVGSLIRAPSLPTLLAVVDTSRHLKRALKSHFRQIHLAIDSVVSGKRVPPIEDAGSHPPKVLICLH